MSADKKLSKSDHCNGEIFFNSGHVVINKTIWDIVKWQFTSRRRKWPKFRENTQKPKLDVSLSRTDCNLTFVNHATVYVQTQQASFLTDPVWAQRTSPFQSFGPKRSRPPGLLMSEIPALDFILLSHNHYDHMDEMTLRVLAKKFDPAIFAPLGLEAPLRDFGFTKIIEMDWWESSTYMDIKVSFLPAFHWSGRWLNDRNKTLWGSFMAQTPTGSIYFAGDSGYSPHFQEIRKRVCAPSIALMPIGAYEPRWFMKQAHMNPAEAVQAHIDLGSRQTMGIHFGTFQLTDEGIDEPILELQKAIDELKPTAPFFVLENGQSKLVSLELVFEEFSQTTS